MAIYGVIINGMAILYGVIINGICPYMELLSMEYAHIWSYYQWNMLIYGVRNIDFLCTSHKSNCHAK